MSGERKRGGVWLLPAIVVAAGAYFWGTQSRAGTLKAAKLAPVNGVGLALMAAGLVCALLKKPALRLAGTLLCGVGAIMVICL